MAQLSTSSNKLKIEKRRKKTGKGLNPCSSVCHQRRQRPAGRLGFWMTAQQPVAQRPPLHVFGDIFWEMYEIKQLKICSISIYARYCKIFMDAHSVFLVITVYARKKKSSYSRALAFNTFIKFLHHIFESAGQSNFFSPSRPSLEYEFLLNNKSQNMYKFVLTEI